MTPGARVQAAIDVLEKVLAGSPAEKELTGWARASRYAGSKDRAAVRDYLFDALRRLRSAAWAGGQGDASALAELDARAVMAGLLREEGADPAMFFTGQGHAPLPIALPPVPEGAPDAVRLDVQDWMLPLFRSSLGERSDAVLAALRDRAPVDLRVNIGRTTPEAVMEALRQAGHSPTSAPISQTAIRLPPGTRGLTATDAFAAGHVELQDAGSQALVERLPATSGGRVLDLCAGGGGKALALAARGDIEVFAHDLDARRMRDIPARAARAGVDIAICANPADLAPFDGVIADVPCSGSGSWRRAPEAKWRLTPERLAELTRSQAAILEQAIGLTRPGGWIAYMTCSLISQENEEVVDRVLSQDGRAGLVERWACTPLDGADGFHLSLLERA